MRLTHGPTPAGGRAAGLRWVIVDGQPAHVSWFAHLPPRRRPDARCPHCDARLTLKLGTMLRHHAAHASTTRCPATRSETALHSDLKHHVAHRLERAAPADRRLVIRHRCAGAAADRCDRVRNEHWCDGWDAVRTEAHLRGDSAGARRPDILLMRDGRAVAAIEILVSHAVADGSAPVRWAEVRAHEALVEGEDAWDIHDPLPVERTAPADGVPVTWRCAEHEAAHTRVVRQRELRRELEWEADRVLDRLLRARVVDLYHADGSHERIIYRLEQQVGRDATALVLRRGTREIARAPVPGMGVSPVTEPSGVPDLAAWRREAWHRLRGCAFADAESLLRRARKQAGEGGEAGEAGFLDSPMRWAAGDVAESLVHEAMYDVAPGQPVPLATRYPRRWYFARGARRWFLPPEMRDVRWDREPGDAFAPHPAWVAGRRALRERVDRAPSAPTGTWRSFVFAGRPRVTDFGAAPPPVADDAPLVVLPFGRRALVLLLRAVPDSGVAQVEAELARSGAEHAWVSHPLDWSAGRAHLPWTAGGRDARGVGVVLVEGVGVYRADRFARAFARGDRRLSPEALRAGSAERVRHLPG